MLVAMRLRIALAILLAALVTTAASECLAACLGVQETARAAPPCHRHPHSGKEALPCVHAKLVGVASELSSVAAAPPAPMLRVPLAPARAKFGVIAGRTPLAEARPPSPALRI